MNIFDFIKSLFKKSTPEYGLGLVESPADSRNIPLSAVQAPMAIPESYMTDLSLFGVNYQGPSSCVGNSVAKMAEYYIYKNTGKLVKIDGEKLYEQCKLEDLIPYQQGTYPQVAIKIAIRDGVDQYGIDSNDKFATGYAFVAIDFESICQALYQNNLATIGSMIDQNWFLGIIGKALKYIGGHQTVLHGYDKTLGRLYGINSWGVNWVGRVAGSLDSRVKPGFYEAKYEDIRLAIINIIVIVPIPKKILDEAKNTGYRFVTTMKIGMTSPEVIKLQEVLGVVPKTGYFGPITQKRVQEYQYNNNLAVDGIVGPAMREKLNKGTKGYMAQWIAAIKQMEGARAELCNPGNIKCDYVKHRDSIGMDSRGICKFPTYEVGYKALETLLTNACTGKSKVYYPEMTITQFYEKYAPDADNNDSHAYARFVAMKLGLPVTTRIKDLL